MPTGPKGEKRPADGIGNAVKIMRIASGEKTEGLPADDGKDPTTKARVAWRILLATPSNFKLRRYPPVNSVDDRRRCAETLRRLAA